MGKSSKIVDVLDKEEEELYEVESILGSRLNPETKKTEYQIKWKGYSVKQSTWQPEEHLSWIVDLIEDFNAKKELKDHKKTHNAAPQQENADKMEENVQDSDQSYDRKPNRKHKKLPKNKIHDKRLPISLSSRFKKQAQSDEVESVSLNSSSILPLSSHNDPDYEVLSMYQARTGQFIYQVRDGDKILWVRREEVVEEHAVELCEFYEKRITWKAK